MSNEGEKSELEGFLDTLDFENRVFEPKVCFIRDADTISYFAFDEPYYEKDVDGFMGTMQVYISEKDGRVIGGRIRGIAEAIRDAI
jgi:hypothetical protein